MLYIDCVLGVLGLSYPSPALLQFRLGLSAGLATLLIKAMFIGMGAAAYGIANEKKWGYILALALTVTDALLLIWAFKGPFNLLRGAPLSALFAAAMVALLAHPMSRNHQRIWFK